MVKLEEAGDGGGWWGVRSGSQLSFRAKRLLRESCPVVTRNRAYPAETNY